MIFVLVLEHQRETWMTNFEKEKILGRAKLKNLSIKKVVLRKTCKSFLDHLMTSPQTLDSKTSEKLADMTLQVPDGVDGLHVLFHPLVGAEAAGLHLLLHQGRPS